jgi:CPA1 family monovalent cation:H+ antiporter
MPIDFIVALLIMSVPLVALARRINVGYPILLVLGGLVLGFILRAPHPEIQPNLILLVFLPPLLYWQAVTAPTVAMRANLLPIGSLAVGLVLVTAATVAVVAHAIVPGIAWPAAIALGAIVAPTDDVAFWPIAQRLALPRRLVALIGGEALLNDAPSLLVYAMAVPAAVSGTFSLHEIIRLIWIIPISVALGALAGCVVTAAWKKLRDPQLQMLVAVIAPYLAYLPAAQLGLSGVLAVLTAALLINRNAHRQLRPQARQHTAVFSEMWVFVINAVMFVLIGFHLHDALPTLAHYPPAVLAGSIVAVNVTIVGLRFAWVFASGVFADGKSRLIAAWSGVRGGISLATALALPVTVAGGTPFAHRDLLILLAFSVILVTLIGQGSTLPWLVGRVRPAVDSAEKGEERHAVATMRAATLRHLNELESKGHIVPQRAEQLRARYVDRVHTSKIDQELVDAARVSLLDVHERGLIDNTVMRRVQAALDMEELTLGVGEEL